MKRTVALIALLVMALAPLVWTAEAWARAGGGSSGGSRGSRSYSSPARPSQSPVSPSQHAAPAPSQQTAPQRPGWGGVLGGLLVGGLIGSLLFGGPAMGGFGGIGLLEILIIGALIWFAMSYMRRQHQAAAPTGYASPEGANAPRWQPTTQYSSASSTVPAEAPVAAGDLARGLAHIRQIDPSFDPARFPETASDIFFRIQAAWMRRDVGVVSALLTLEMQGILQGECDRLRAQRRINRLESIAVRSAEVTEAWQEGGQDYVTVHFLASLLDYTTDDSGDQVLEGSRTEPVKFEEYWTFVRPVGPNPWRLSAIQQA